jgi:hypothetical protein
METTFIDEREIIEKFVKRTSEINKMLIDCLNREMIKYGLNPNHYVGGIQGTISSEKLTLEANLNNLFAAFTANFVESISFQCENIKHMNTLNLVQDYLRLKGLEADFLKFRDRTTQKRIG